MRVDTAMRLPGFRARAAAEAASRFSVPLDGRSFLGLPSQLYGKLHLPRRRVGADYRSRRRNLGSVGVQERRVLPGRLEIRPVEKVENISPNLHIETLCDLLDRNVPGEREVEIGKSRTN